MKNLVENIFTINNLNIIMPTVLVLCAFGLKIFKKSPPDIVDFISTVIELPMDIIILALGYMSSYTCLSPDNISVGFGMFSVEIVLAIFIFGFSKSSISIFQSTKRDHIAQIEMIVYCLISYVLALGSYIISVSIYGG